jgi:hypothetical protein
LNIHCNILCVCLDQSGNYSARVSNNLTTLAMSLVELTNFLGCLWCHELSITCSGFLLLVYFIYLWVEGKEQLRKKIHKTQILHRSPCLLAQGSHQSSLLLTHTNYTYEWDTLGESDTCTDPQNR